MPNYEQKYYNLLIWLAKESNYSTKSVSGKPNNLSSIIGAVDGQEVVKILDDIWNKRLIEVKYPGEDSLKQFGPWLGFHVHLTPNGIKKAAAIPSSQKPSEKEEKINEKRNIELIRKLFLKIESFPFTIQENFDYEIRIEGYSKEQINFSLSLMKQENYIDGIFHRSIINKHLEVSYETLEVTAKGYKYFDKQFGKSLPSGIRSNNLEKSTVF